jgi:hypothetical protein
MDKLISQFLAKKYKKEIALAMLMFHRYIEVMTNGKVDFEGHQKTRSPSRSNEG